MFSVLSVLPKRPAIHYLNKIIKWSLGIQILRNLLTTISPQQSNASRTLDDNVTLKYNHTIPLGWISSYANQASNLAMSI